VGWRKNQTMVGWELEFEPCELIGMATPVCFDSKLVISWSSYNVLCANILHVIWIAKEP
jgi:hypothetical protein